MTPSKQRLRVWVGRLLGYGVAVACLYWVFHGVRLRDVWQALDGVTWWWVGLSVLLDLLAYCCVAWEWQVLLRPVGRVSLWRLSQAVFAGRFANDVLPVHIGYVIRVYLVSRWLDVGMDRVIPSLVAERLFEAFLLATGIGLLALRLPLPHRVVTAGESLGALVLGGLILIGIGLWYRRKLGAQPAGSKAHRWQRVLTAIDRVIGGIRGIGRVQLLVAGGALALLKLAVQAMAFIVLLWAYGFHLSMWVQIAVFLVAYVGMSLPSTPASVGVFQLFCVAGLQAFHVPKPDATSFALLAFAVLTAPLSLAGFWAVMHTGLSLREIRQQAGRWKEAIKAGHQ